MWNLVPWPGIKHGPPASGVWSLSPWTTRVVPSLWTSNWWKKIHTLRLGTNFWDWNIFHVVNSSWFWSLLKNRSFHLSLTITCRGMKTMSESGLIATECFVLGHQFWKCSSEALEFSESCTWVSWGSDNLHRKASCYLPFLLLSFHSCTVEFFRSTITWFLKWIEYRNRHENPVVFF